MTCASRLCRWGAEHHRLPRQPLHHRRIPIGKTHWLYYRIEDDGASALVYWMHGVSRESGKLTSPSLKREASAAAKERDGS